jgi:hypothetical protein
MEDQVCSTIQEGFKIMKETQEAEKYLHPYIINLKKNINIPI